MYRIVLHMLTQGRLNHKLVPQNSWLIVAMLDANRDSNEPHNSVQAQSIPTLKPLLKPYASSAQFERIETCPHMPSHMSMG
ncbi:hypothetical protein N656DRAFT_602055 [Canariomyces notabilis]|uniref:Uncharacterized protein n=1 Tax=Canariomyces notabilis TaxID=2074819 RepID=A0AAN6YTT4_9PEZI|nr:hypothetical protein N656DRAFT_602055 [Canariomyces arenarius]